jgi:pyruvate dehydrogenase E1 component alpha subunit
MDPEAVRDAAAEAVARGRDGGGPSFVECLTYRYDAHHTWEHKARPRYRDAAEVAAGRTRDPVEIQGGRLAAGERQRIDDEIEALLDRAVAFARESPRPDPTRALDHLYASGLRARSGSSGGI